MQLFWRRLDKLLDHFSTLLFIAFFICILLQVFFRYVLSLPLTWTEEASRYLNMWSVLIGAALGVHANEHLRVDLIDRWIENVHPKTKMILYLIITFFSSLSMVALLIGSVIMTHSSWGIRLTMIPLPQGILYLGAALGSAFMTLFFLKQLVTSALQLGDKEARP
ncbi:MAG TPA: TRAP transporter small permease [Bacillales bacterium]|nr:TRAP transporter small permease [Bacillales bacterium]